MVVMDWEDKLVSVQQSDIIPGFGHGEQDVQKDSDEGYVVDRIATFRQNLPKHGVTLFSHRSAPNGFKVAVVLSELGIDYHTFNMDLQHHEERLPSYVELNPNARIPSIIDHDNDDFALWESGAILEYLCRRPQTLEKCPEFAKQLLGGDNLQRQAEVSAWLYFQASGHAPIIGHALQFKSAQANVSSLGMSIIADRFAAEARRVVAVLEVCLAEKREQLATDERCTNEEDYLECPVWLVGNDITLADLSFVPWNQVFAKVGISLEEDYPEVYKWNLRIMSRPKVMAALGFRPEN